MATLQEVQQMAALMIDLERQKAAAEEVVSALAERIRIVKEETIPCAMQELGLESFELATGEKVSVSQEVYASISVANKAQAFNWLEEHGFGGLIKTDVEANFGRNERERAAEIVQLLAEHGVAATASNSVHPQTLKAFCKEQIAEGKELPMDLFGCRPTWTTKLKAAKKA